MKFSVATLLATFADDKFVAPKVLEKKLGCEDEGSLRELQITLDALEKTGILEKERGKYRRVQNTGYIEGRLRCSSKGFCFAIQDLEDAEDIYIRDRDLNHSWNGDRVLVAVTKEASRRRSPEGRVQLVMERANTSVLARVKSENHKYSAVPLDDRLLFELDLDADEAELSTAVDHLVNVEVARYPLGRHAPIGRLAQVLGSDAEAASDIDIVCCKHSLPGAFSESLELAAKMLPTRVRKADTKDRLDLREEITVAIHGAEADSAAGMMDNAISLVRTSDDLWKLSVHTVDVAFYVPVDSGLDQEARRRSTAVYLGETVIPLLPEQISQNLCSFQPGKDRLGVTLVMLLDDAGEVQSFEVQPSVLSADAALSYHQAQRILDRDAKTKNIKKYKDVFKLIDQLASIGQSLRQQRYQRGAFELNLPERLPAVAEAKDDVSPALYSRFAYNDEGILGAMVVAEALPIRGLLAEIMLLANQLIAKHLQALSVPLLYRVHRAPDRNSAQELVKLAVNLDIELELDEEDDEVTPQVYQNFLEKFGESEAERVMIYLLQQTLKSASYSLTPGKHFGLAISAEDGYTHFTCPARRYCDLQIQRVLHAVFESGRDRRTTRSKDRVNLRSSESHGNVNWNVLPPDVHQDLELQHQAIVVQLSEREMRAQDAEEDLIGLKKAEFMKAHTGEVFNGLITRVQNYGFFVEIEDWLVEGLVHVSSLKDDWYEHRIRQQRLVGRKNRQQYGLGDRVEVQVKSVDYYRQQIDLMVVGGGSESEEEGEDNGREPSRENGREGALEPSRDRGRDLILDQDDFEEEEEVTVTEGIDLDDDE